MPSHVINSPVENGATMDSMTPRNSTPCRVLRNSSIRQQILFKRTSENQQEMSNSSKKLKVSSHVLLTKVEKVKRDIMHNLELVKPGEEENVAFTLNKMQSEDNLEALDSKSKPKVETEISNVLEFETKSIFVAAQSLIDLSRHTFLNEGSSPQSNDDEKEEEEYEDSEPEKETEVDDLEPQNEKSGEENPEDETEECSLLNNETYRSRAQELLFGNSDILVGERKDAFFELVRLLCPYISIVRSGTKTLRTYLVDTRKKKRYRTYSDAIKGGALDPLILETGTVVLLKGCIEEAKRRFEIISQKKIA